MKYLLQQKYDEVITISIFILEFLLGLGLELDNVPQDDKF